MVIVNSFGLLLIALVVWWFWLYKPKEVATSEGTITIIVENGTYEPSRIRLPQNQSSTLRFIRKDESPCAATVVFADLNIAEELLLNEPREIRLPPLEPGEYSFTCQMQMYRGELLVGDTA